MALVVLLFLYISLISKENKAGKDLFLTEKYNFILTISIQDDYENG